MVGQSVALDRRRRAGSVSTQYPHGSARATRQRSCIWRHNARHGHIAGHGGAHIERMRHHGSSCCLCAAPLQHAGATRSMPRVPARSSALATSAARAYSPVRQVSWDQVDKKKFNSLGPLAFGLVKTVIYPADVVKTRMQMQRASMLASSAGARTSGTPLVYRSTFDAIRTISQREGAASFYKGFAPSLLGVLGSHLYVVTLESMRTRLLLRWQERDASSRLIKDPIAARSVVNAQAGAVAVLATHLLTTPLEVVSQKMRMLGQVDRTGRLVAAPVRSAGHVASQIWRTDRLRGLYRGFGAQLLSSVPTHALFWSLYHRLVEELPGWGSVFRPAHQQAASGSLPQQSLDADIDTTMLVQGTAAGVSGATAVLLMNPLDVVKTRLQVEGTRGQTTLSTARAVLRGEGVLALWKGCSARVMAAVCTAVPMIVYFEALKRMTASSLYERMDDAMPMGTVHAKDMRDSKRESGQ